MNRIGSEAGFLARQSSIYAVGNLLQRISSLLLLPVYTHYLTTSDYGIKELLTITTDVASVLISAAVSLVLYRIYYQYDDEGSRKQVISSSYIYMAGAGGLVLLALVPFTGWLSKLILGEPGLRSYLLISFGALWFQMINRISYDYLRARQKAMQVVAFSLLRLVLGIGLNIWFIVGRGMGVIGVLWSTLITGAVIFVLLTVPQVIRVGLRFSWPIMKEMYVFGLPLVWSQLGSMVVHLSDRFFIKSMISLGETGVYSLGYRLGTLPSMAVVEPFNQTWLPRRYEIHRQPDHARTFGRIFTYYVGGLGFAALAISVLARDLVRIMSEQSYWGAAAVVPVVALANGIFALHYHLNFGLMLAKKSKTIAAINMSNAVLVLGLNWFLIPRLGMMGAAWATLAGFVFKISVTWYFSRQHYRPEFEGRRLAHLLVTGGLIYGVSRLVYLDAVWPNAAINCGLLTIYPLSLWFTGFLHPGEKDAARRLARRVLRRPAAA